MKAIEELEEPEILALAIALEEEDSRIYKDFAQRLKERHPETSSILESMHKEEWTHHLRLKKLFQKRFGEHIPYIRRQDVKGFLKRRPSWLSIVLKPSTVRRDVLQMEAESRRFYEQAMHRATSSEVKDLLNELALAEEDHQDSFVEKVKEQERTKSVAEGR
jgi:rubrerythrin